VGWLLRPIQASSVRPWRAWLGP